MPRSNVHDAAQDEHVVVHREPEQDQNMKIGSHEAMRRSSGSWDVLAPTPLEVGITTP